MAGVGDGDWGNDSGVVSDAEDRVGMVGRPDDCRDGDHWRGDSDATEAAERVASENPFEIAAAERLVDAADDVEIVFTPRRHCRELDGFVKIGASGNTHR